MKNHIFLLGLLSLFILFSGCTASIDDGTLSGSTSVGSVNSGASSNLINITIEYSSSTDNILVGSNEYIVDQAKSGNTFLVVDMTITNNGYSEFSTNPFYFSVIVDNVKYNTAFVYNLENELGTRTILNNGKISGKLAFEVPESVTDFILVYEAFRTYNIEFIEK